MAVKTFKEYLVGKGLTIYETPVTVLIGGDTRPSTEPLLALLADGIKYEKGNALNFHLTTTPQLQYYGKFVEILSLPCQCRTQKAYH